ncbi:MAG: 30S ribosomal protein S6 [Chloroflexota bacterium]
MSLRRIYETTFIVNAALEDNDVDAVLTKVQTYIENHGGTIMEVNKWGRRRLAYPINKKYNGFYIHLIFETIPSVVPVLERFLVLEDTVLRHLTLQLSQRLRDQRNQRAMAEGKQGSGAYITSVSDEPARPAEEGKDKPKAEGQPEETAAPVAPAIENEA